MQRVNGRFIWVSLTVAIATWIWGSWVILFSLLGVPRSWLQMCSSTWAQWILAASGVRVKVQGLEHIPNGSGVLVGNHQGMFDILAIMASFPEPPVFVAKHSLFHIPLLGLAMKRFGHIPVNRSQRDQAIASINASVSHLKKWRDKVVFFPEGTRPRDGVMKPFKKGAFIFAKDHQLPLIPFAIEGSFQTLPPEQRRILPGTIQIIVMPAIDLQHLSVEESIKTAQSQISETLEHLLKTA